MYVKLHTHLGIMWPFVCVETMLHVNKSILHHHTLQWGNMFGTGVVGLTIELCQNTNSTSK